MNLENTMERETSQTQNIHTLHDSIYMKSPGTRKYRQKLDPRTERRENGKSPLRHIGFLLV